jgi:hypothetical protein
MTSPVTWACDTCSGIFVNDKVPAMYAKYSWKESHVHYLWHKTAQDLQSSIASGCSMCKALHRYFQIGYLKSHLYNRTGDIKLCFAYIKLDKFMLGIFPEKEDAIPDYGWLSYQLAAASGGCGHCFLSLYAYCLQTSIPVLHSSPDGLWTTSLPQIIISRL